MSDVTASYGVLLDFIVSSPNFHRLYVKSIHTFSCVDIPDVTTSYEESSGLSGFFGNLNF